MADENLKEEPTIYDAVTEAVKEVSPEPAKEPDTGATDDGASAETDEETGEEETGQEDGADGGDETGEEGKDDDDEGSEAGGEEGADEGDPKKKKDEEGGEGKEGKEGDGDGKKGGDPVNDLIPEGLKEATRERIQTLATRVKELAPAAQERDELLQAIESTGSTPEQYAQTLQFLSFYNSDQPTHRKQAFGVLKGMLHELAVELNEDVSLDPLAQYADLQAEVEEKTLTEERAREIARGRERDRINNERREHQTQTENQQNATRQAVETGKTELNTLEQQLKARDGELYGRKKAALIPVLKTIMRQVHPTRWKATFLEAYNGMPDVPAASPNPTPPKPGQGQQPARGQQPMRAKQGAGESQKAPTSGEEAIKQALGMS